MRQIKVLIICSPRLLCEGVREIVSAEKDILVLGTAIEKEALKMMDLKPDILLLGIRTLTIEDKIEMVKKVKEKCPQTKIIILTTSFDEGYLLELLRAGASGYISQNAPVRDLTQAIRKVFADEIWVERRIMMKLLEGVWKRPESTKGGIENRLELLTIRETEVLKLLASGHRNKEIADKLFISEKTVKTHLNTIFKKLNVSDRVQAAIYATRSRLLEE